MFSKICIIYSKYPVHHKVSYEMMFLPSTSVHLFLVMFGSHDIDYITNNAHQFVRFPAGGTSLQFGIVFLWTL
jgi:hypothetical protein